MLATTHDRAPRLSAELRNNTTKQNLKGDNAKAWVGENSQRLLSHFAKTSVSSSETFCVCMLCRTCGICTYISVYVCTYMGRYECSHMHTCRGWTWVSVLKSDYSLHFFFFFNWDRVSPWSTLIDRLAGQWAPNTTSHFPLPSSPTAGIISKFFPPPLLSPSAAPFLPPFFSSTMSHLAPALNLVYSRGWPWSLDHPASTSRMMACQSYRHVPPCPVYAMLAIESRVSTVVGAHSPRWAIALALKLNLKLLSWDFALRNTESTVQKRVYVELGLKLCFSWPAWLFKEIQLVAKIKKWEISSKKKI